MTCKLLGYERSAYYKAKNRTVKKAVNENIILEIVHAEKKILNQSGGKKLFHLLKSKIAKTGIKIGRDKFLNILRKNGLLIKKKKYKMPKTESNHPFYIHKNLIESLEIKYPNQVWVSDITYIKVNGKWNYLTLITDVFSRKIVGFSFSKGMSVEETSTTAFYMAIKNRKNVSKTILHSDRGFQYCNPNFVKKINSKGVISSMGKSGNPYDNAIAERVNGILKYEFALRFEFKNFDIANQEILKAINLYNNKRPHWSLNLSTPEFVFSNNQDLIEKSVSLIY